MYTPKSMDMESVCDPLEFIKQFPFALMISKSLEASHCPLILQANSSGTYSLIGHLAKVNHHLDNIDGREVLAVFSGPHGYISPCWYAKSPAVPTWNYASVHVLGKIERLNNEGTLSVVEKLTEYFEPELMRERTIVSQEVCDKLLKGIVGFKMSIDSIQGKLKLGQHRSKADQKGVAQGLENSTHLDSKALLAFMRKLSCGLGE